MQRLMKSLVLGLLSRPLIAIQLLPAATALPLDDAFGHSDWPDSIADRRRDDGPPGKVHYCDLYTTTSEGSTYTGTCYEWPYPPKYNQWAAQVNLKFLPGCFIAPSNMNMFACPRGARYPELCSNSTVLYQNDQAWNDSDHGQ